MSYSEWFSGLKKKTYLILRKIFQTEKPKKIAG